MSITVLILDDDSTAEELVREAGDLPLFASTIDEAENLLFRKSSLVSRVLISPKSAPSAGISFFKKVLAINPQISAWMIVDDIRPWSSACRIMGYQGLFVKKRKYPWVKFREGPQPKNELVEVPLDCEMAQVFPSQLEHGDPLRFSLYCKTYGGYVRLFATGTPPTSAQLARIADPMYYVRKRQITNFKRLLRNFELQTRMYPDLHWEEQMVQFVTGPIALGIA